ncbi:hypothetical protein D3C75_1258580 [compost metagenome]
MLAQQRGQGLQGSIPGRLPGVTGEGAAAQPLVLVAVPAAQADAFGAEHGAVTGRGMITQ